MSSHHRLIDILADDEAGEVIISLAPGRAAILYAAEGNSQVEATIQRFLDDPKNRSFVEIGKMGRRYKNRGCPDARAD